MISDNLKLLWIAMGGMEDIAYNNCKIMLSKFDELHLKYTYVDKLTLIADGQHDKEFVTKYQVVDQSSSVDVRMLRRGGFAAVLKPLQ